MPNTAKVTRPEWLALALILAVAALLRMGWPGLTEFKQDEAHLYSLALDVAELRALPLRGISLSVGLPNSPISVYLYALPLFLWKSPVAATLFVGLLNTASVAVGYWLARRYWGVRVALISALLFAAAPWAVIYSRKLWSNDLLPFFTVSCLATGLLGLAEGRRRWLIAHLVLLALVIQIHPSGLLLVPLTLMLGLVYRRHLDRRALLAGAGLAALTALPITVYVLSRLGDLASASALLAAEPATLTADSLTLVAMLVQGTHVRGLTGPEAFRAFDATIPNFNPLLWLGGLLVVAGLGLVVWRWWQTRGQPRPLPVTVGALVALWVILPSLFFLRHSTPVYAHYFIILFPAPYFLSALALDAAMARWRQPCLWVLPLAIAGSQVWLSLALLRFIGTTDTPGAFGTPLGLLLRAAETASALGAEVVVVADGTDPAHDQAPAVFDALLRHTPHRFVDAATTAVFPAGNSAILHWPSAAAPAWPAESLYRAWGGGQWAARVPLRAGEGEALIAVGTGTPPAVPQPRPASALLANGVEILGTGEAATGWELWWRAPGPFAGEPYHLFAHLLADDGLRLAQVDAPTYSPAAWQPGDLVVNYFALPPGGATVRAGMYAYPSLAPVPVLDAAGQPAGDWLDFPRD